MATVVEKSLTAILVPIMVPFVIVMYVIKLFTKGEKFSQFFEDADMMAEADAHFERITAEIVDTTPSLDQHAKYKARARALIEREDWVTLADWMTDLDQQRTVCEANLSLSDTVLEDTLETLSIDIFEGHACHPDPILHFDIETAEKLESLSLQHPQHYPLRVIAAHIRCYQGWTYRGADYAAYVSDDGWHGMGSLFGQAQMLLRDVDPVEMNAPMIAAARHKLLAFMPNAHSHVQRFYREWTALDPKNQTPHRRHAMMMLPRWFGSQTDLENAAAEAAAATHMLTGDAAYFTMYRTVLDDWDPHVLAMNMDRFAQGAHDFLTLRGNDPAVVSHLISTMAWWSAIGSARGLTKAQKVKRKELSNGFKSLSKDLIRTRLTAIYPPAWKNGAEECQFEILTACKEEVDAGFEMTLGPNGIAFADPQGDALTP